MPCVMTSTLHLLTHFHFAAYLLVAIPNGENFRLCARCVIPFFRPAATFWTLVTLSIQ